MFAAVWRLRHLVKATEVTAGLAESNGSLLPGLWRDSLPVTCGLTACTLWSAPGPTLGNEYGKTLPLPFAVQSKTKRVNLLFSLQTVDKCQKLLFWRYVWNLYNWMWKLTIEELQIMWEAYWIISAGCLNANDFCQCHHLCGAYFWHFAGYQRLPELAKGLQLSRGKRRVAMDVVSARLGVDVDVDTPILLQHTAKKPTAPLFCAFPRRTTPLPGIEHWHISNLLCFGFPHSLLHFSARYPHCHWKKLWCYRQHVTSSI